MATAKAKSAARPAAKETRDERKRRTGATPTRTAATKPSSFSLKLPLGQGARVVLGGLSRLAFDELLTASTKAPSEMSIEDRAKLQVKRAGRWVTAPDLASVGPAAAAVMESAAADEMLVAAAPGRTASSSDSPFISEGASPQSLSDLPARMSSVKRVSVAHWHRLPGAAPMSMDPRLQLAVVNRQRGKHGVSMGSAGGDELAVVARVANVQAWRDLPDVLPGAEIGAAHDGSMVVTGRIPIGRIEAVRSSPVVRSLKASQPVQPALEATVRTMRVGAGQVPPSAQPNAGAGVVGGTARGQCADWR